MTKLSGIARRMDSGFRRNDGRGRHPGQSRDPQRSVSARPRATLHWLLGGAWVCRALVNGVIF